MVSQRGIEVNPDKIKAILDMAPPRTIKEVQRLTGRVASLGRFMSRSGDRCLPFFNTLKKVKNFEWIEECQRSFEQLKEYLAAPPLLAKLNEGEVLYLYLTITKVAVSVVLVKEEDNIQKPVY